MPSIDIRGFNREAFIETRGNWVGFGLTGDAEDREIFLGFMQITLSKTRERGVKAQKKLKAIGLAFLCGLAIPTDYSVATEVACSISDMITSGNVFTMGKILGHV